MSRSRPPIDVSSHLIEPGPSTEPATVIGAAIFGNDRPVELEIGSGKGLFLANAARANPGHNFLGVELSRKYAWLAAARLVKLGIPNAKVWAGDARDVLARRLPDCSLRAIHVYFPDPWWKKRHKKRRVFTESLVAQIVRTLQPEGELHVATDVEEYFTIIRDLITACRHFHEQPILVPEGPDHDRDDLTNFERKYRLEGRPIYRAAFRLEAGLQPVTGRGTDQE